MMHGRDRDPKTLVLNEINDSHSELCEVRDTLKALLDIIPVIDKVRTRKIIADITTCNVHVKRLDDIKTKLDSAANFNEIYDCHALYQDAIGTIELLLQLKASGATPTSPILFQTATPKVEKKEEKSLPSLDSIPLRREKK